MSVEELETLETEQGLANAAAEIAESALPHEEIEPVQIEGEGKESKQPERAIAPVQKAAGDGQPVPGATPPAAIPPPPDTLRKEIKENWASYPESIRAEFIKREQDFRQGMEQVRPSAELGNGFLKVLEPYLPVFKQYGVNPVSHVDNLVKYHAVLMFGTPQQKMEVIGGLIADSGIDPRALMQGFQGQQSPDIINSLQREIAALKGQLTGVSSRFSQADAAMLEQKIIEIGDDGNHPYFWDVAPTMVQLYQRYGSNLPIEDAYRMALAANPQFYDRLLNDRAQENIKRQSREAQERAEKARKAKGVRLQSSSPTRPASREPGNVLDLDSILKENLAEIQAR